VTSPYAAAAVWRRRWYERHPDARRRLHRPVVSVGNLSLGGSGKTPVVAHVAFLLRDLGHRPAILSRGYGRRIPADGVVVVRDATRILADVDRAGDEPMMLAHALDGVAIVVGANRWIAGRLAEQHLGATVHILDDGFQHLALDRDVDLLVLGRDDLTGAVLPAGRLREPLDAAQAADAVLVADVSAAEADEMARRVSVPRGFALARHQGDVRGAAADARHAPVLALAGIARPERFFRDLRDAGWTLAATSIYRDHHRFTPDDAKAIAAQARASGASLVVTTEKDFVRLLPLRPFPISIVAVPLHVTAEPADPFRAWLASAVPACC
jgi:tetraacyldisaccharide 4'-kinase